MTIKLKRYVYQANDKNEEAYTGSYTIKDGVEPLGLKNEKLVQEFEIVR